MSAPEQDGRSPSGRATAVEPLRVSPLRDGIPSAASWMPAKCRVPMWMGGCPAGFCDAEAYGHQLPRELLVHDGRIGLLDRPAYCHGHACPDHGGPRENEPRIFQDGYTEQGRPMWCAVHPDFENLQESPAEFDGDPVKARAMLLSRGAA